MFDKTDLEFDTAEYFGLPRNWPARVLTISPTNGSHVSLILELLREVLWDQ